jgi:hypothetical protein
MFFGILSIMIPAQTLRVAEASVEEALKEKIGAIAQKEKEQETEVTAQRLGLGYINLVGFPIGPETISAIKKTDAERLKTVCFLKTMGQIRLGTTNPANPDIQAMIVALGNKLHAQVELYIISEHSYMTALRLYDRLPRVRKMTSDIEIATGDLERFQ